MTKILTKELREKVSDLLAKYPILRDNDSKLIVNIWAIHLGRNQVNSMSAADLMTMLARNELPSSSTIRRIRRKLQEENSELRGELWTTRHKELESQVKEEIRDSNSWRIKYD
jgi:hypothetical protein